MEPQPSISIIGLGRVGLPLARSFAEHDARVLGIDRDPDLIASIRAGRMPSSERSALGR